MTVAILRKQFTVIDYARMRETGILSDSTAMIFMHTRIQLQMMSCS